MTHNKCFVCSTNNDFGLKAKFITDTLKHKSYCKIIIPYNFQGWDKYVHGGIIASLLDDCIVYACKASGFDCLTAELTIKYKKPVFINEEIKLEGEIIEIKKNKLLLAKSKLEINGNILAEAKAKMFVINKLGEIDEYTETIK